VWSRRHMMRHMHPNGDTSATGHTTGQRGGKRYSIPDAAKVLGLTDEAVRQRVKRGTLDSIKVGGSLFVLLDNDTSPNVSNDQEQPVSDRSHDTSSDTSRLVETLEGEVAYLRRQLDQANERDSENRRIIAALTQRIPELEAASEARDGSESASPRSDRGAAPEDSQEGAQRRSWLYRFFFGP
jgi:hypothetical protein